MPHTKHSALQLQIQWINAVQGNNGCLVYHNKKEYKPIKSGLYSFVFLTP
jgi:hypothetical protein